MRDEIAAALDDIDSDFGGGCTVNKAYVLASLIRWGRLTRTADIGVYRGRSFFPQAIAHRRYTGGIVYGIDPWKAEEARQKDQPELKDALDAFVARTDFQALYEQAERRRLELGVWEHTELRRQTSAAAADSFDATGLSFGLVHIDGNHDTRRVVEDVNRYLARLEPQGFIVLDDISWRSIRPAYEWLAGRLTLVYERLCDLTRDHDDYAVFWRGQSVATAEAMRRMLTRLGGPERRRG